MHRRCIHSTPISPACKGVGIKRRISRFLVLFEAEIENDVCELAHDVRAGQVVVGNTFRASPHPSSQTLDYS